MKKVLAKIAGYSTAAGLALHTLSARALDLNGVRENVAGDIATETNIVDTVFRVINWILIVTGAFAVLFLIIGGFRYITSAGNETQVEEAKRTMTYAIIGLVIVLLAFVIAATINSFLVE